jgi:hypothetical protein
VSAMRWGREIVKALGQVVAKELENSGTTGLSRQERRRSEEMWTLRLWKSV